MKITHSSAAVLLLNGAVAVAQPTNGSTGVVCPSTSKFTPLSAGTFFAKLNPGWNVGNTLDAVQNEGDWNNPPVVASTFDDVKRAGFKSVRIPVTWAYHFTSQGPNWTVDPAWLQRVEDVVDMVTQRGLYAIVNVHHDSWTWADLTSASTNVTALEERFSKLWLQIGTKLACKSELVAFEPINEIPGTTPEHGAIVNRLNDIFLQKINEAGGHNSKRVVTLVGAGEDGVKTSLWFKKPDDKFKNPWGIQFHYYSPYDYVFQAWGKTTWGSEADKASLEGDLAAVRSNFTDVPIVIGEWAVSPVATETAARWRYFDFFVRTAGKYNMSTVLWDNGADFLNRATHIWRDEVAMDIFRNAIKGIPNALPASTTDGAITTQQSSAYIYHAKNETVKDVTLSFTFNGNTLSKISKGSRQLAKEKDFTLSGQDITFKAAYLSTIITPSSPTGSLTNLTLTFNRGAALQVNVLQYSTPVLSSTSGPLPAAGQDLRIPVAWAGINRPAAVKAQKSDGTYLVDDWTQYLGPLQQGRMTYGNQWDWDANNVIIKAAAVDAVRAANKDTTLTIEFYPRQPGNNVVYTLKV
ncbi:glycoside hydrolase family 5 protein [Bipolaris sorokiniana ND90Pr]|uniref:Glycoside hydrolase family 5 protein n=1 Tax=Cochliobolus sativus (strain ND90Pr / ATCC 201652) TaxID=665912 RepID=M2STZ9_COCSN|nr:glycoside hydrolase family 5 protein [Bipolaris sorokiniana ND90Pr]EMD65765.1 glycoside hydrolase family 5 protein [Bipolaris sorokiniana ND90Pr]